MNEGEMMHVMVGSAHSERINDEMRKFVLNPDNVKIEKEVKNSKKLTIKEALQNPVPGGRVEKLLAQRGQNQSAQSAQQSMLV